MRIFKEIAPLQQGLNEYRAIGQKIGLVPTMGALHDGHLSLIKASKEKTDITICSIYINPTQFNNNQDLEKYPRTMERDITMLQQAGCDMLFCPSDDVIYPYKPKVLLSFPGLDDMMEGKFRPGHFSGVGLIVSKLFNIVNPHRAYFGQKDLQQFLVIKQLVQDLSFNMEVECVEIMRDRDGLAMSSRNKRLSVGGREQASVFYKALILAQNALAEGVSWEQAKGMAIATIEQAGVSLEYFEMVDSDTLVVLSNNFKGKNVALCVAGYIDGVRLIDNIIFNLDF